MSKHIEPILIVSDNEHELEEIKLPLSTGYSRLHATLDQESAIAWFEEAEAAVLLLNFRSLHRAEAFYLKLFHSCERIYEIPHQVIVFIVRNELERAYELCRREIFHSFVIMRPMLSEHFLRLAVIHALEKRASHRSIQRGRDLLKRLAEQIEQMRNEFDQLIAENKHLLEQRNSAKHSLANSIKYRLGVFRDSLMGHAMEKVVTVHDANALNKEFDQLQEREIASQLEQFHQQMDEALGSWTGNLEKHLSMLEQASSDASQSGQIQPPQVLIIDDDDIQRHMLTSVLEAEGYVVHQAANGNEGMSMLQSTTPDLVLLDYEMPELDGVTLLKKVRSSSLLKDLPIIMLTGHHEKEVVKRCMESGANDYLVKPVEIRRLHERLSQHLPAPPQPNGKAVIRV